MTQPPPVIGPDTGAAQEMVFERQGRSPRAIAVVVAIWAALIAALAFLEAAPLLIAGLAAFTLPALRDIAMDRRAGLRVDRRGIAWHSGRRQAHVTWGEVDHIALHRRLDFSRRICVVLKDGGKLRLPEECAPPAPDLITLEAVLSDLGQRCQHHPFQLF